MGADRQLALEEARERVALLEAARERHAANPKHVEMLDRALKVARERLKVLQAESLHEDLLARNWLTDPQ